MKIHNFYCDLLLSIRSLFDDYIFSSNFIKKYEFNIGNRAFQINNDYKPNYEFPVCLVTLNDESPIFGQRPEVSQGIYSENINQIPVLYNFTNDHVIMLQEEHENIPVNIIINCESQLQAKSVANAVKRYLPLNKYIEFLEFTSFLEVPTMFFGNDLFNPHHHNILNLFTKYDKNLGEPIYCFAVKYRPLIRLDSSSAAIPDSSQRSFQVNIDLTYLIQFPSHVFLQKMPHTIDRINIEYQQAYEPISDYPVDVLINKNTQDIKDGFVRRTLLISDPDILQQDELSADITLKVPYTHVENDDFSLILDSKNNLFITDKLLDKTLKVKNESGIIPFTGGYYSVSVDETSTLVMKFINYTYFKLKFTTDDLVLKPEYKYYFYTKNNKEKTLIPYDSFDATNNEVTFKFETTNWYEPDITNPLFIQIYDEGENPKTIKQF